MKTKLIRVKLENGQNEIFLAYKDNKTTFSIAKLNQLSGHFEGYDFWQGIDGGFKQVEIMLNNEVQND